MSVFVSAIVLLWDIFAWAQTAADDDADVVILKEGLFWRPEGVTWFHTYVDPWWLLAMTVVAFLMLWVAKWMDEDARRLGVYPVKWNYTTMSICFLSLVAFFVIPPYVSVPAALVSLLVVVCRYVPVRNRRVLPSRRLFTPEHRVLMRKKFLRVFGIKSRELERKLARVAKKHVPVTLFFQVGRVASPAEAPPDERDPATVVKEVVGQAVLRHAREIYVVPKAGRFAVSLKIDGMEHSGGTLERLRGSALIGMVKHLADLASDEPHFRIQLPTVDARLTVSVRVSGEGSAERIMMRLTPDGERLRRLGELGLTSRQAETLRRALEQAQGMMAVTGPAEMGSRTTICAMLDSLDPYSRNIVTFERPVTVSLASIEQNDLTRMEEPLGELLAEKLRQDYDLMMLGELPDKETALVGLTAAQRQQFVIAHFELSDVVGVVEHLFELGVEPPAVAAGLHTLVAQRLVRVLCQQCRLKTVPSAELLQKIHVDPSRVEFLWEESSGCEACGRTGFHGRTGIFEVWQPSQASRKLIAERAEAAELRAAAQRDGMVSLQHSGLMLVVEGVTGLKELAQVLKTGT